MNMLILDTTRKVAYVLLKKEDKVVLDKLGENEKHSENLMIHIDNLLEKEGVRLNDIDAFGVVLGPGSFTGIRVGLATVKAFSYALNKPIIGLNVFELIAESVKDGVFVTECTANSAYYAVVSKNKILETGVVQNDQILGLGDNLFVLENEHFMDLNSYKFNILKDYPSMLISGFGSKLENGRFSSELKPYYVQLSQAERNLGVNNDKKSDN